MKITIKIDDENGGITELTPKQYIEFRDNIEKLFKGAFEDPFTNIRPQPTHPHPGYYPSTTWPNTIYGPNTTAGPNSSITGINTNIISDLVDAASKG